MDKTCMGWLYIETKIHDINHQHLNQRKPNNYNILEVGEIVQRNKIF